MMNWRTGGRSVIALLALVCALGSTSASAETPPFVDATSTEILEDVRGRDAKVVLLNVWAMWCQPCKDEMPHLVEIAHEWRDRGVEIVLVSVDFKSEREGAHAFLETLGVDFPTYFQDGEDDETFIEGIYAGWSGTLPATLLFDEKGEVVQFWEGDASREFFEARILEVLEGRPGFPETTVKKKSTEHDAKDAAPAGAPAGGHDNHDHGER